MGYTRKQIDGCLKRLSRLKPSAHNSSYEYKAKETIRLMAPKLLEMKNDGFTVNELATELAKDGINIPSTTLSRYLNIYQNPQKEKSKSRQMDLDSDAIVVTHEKSDAHPVAENDISEKQHAIDTPADEKKVIPQGTLS